MISEIVTPALAACDAAAPRTECAEKHLVSIPEGRILTTVLLLLTRVSQLETRITLYVDF